ncbi:MAG: tetratricopeptide repeat protein [Rhizobiales bacterium]|nr:tetratricopeptide repeat protein [Hyphomicrobiales bacterium]
MSNLFNEIDEDLRQDKLKTLWNKYRAAVFTFVIVIALGLTSSEFYQYWSTSKEKNSGLIFSKIIDNIIQGDIQLAQDNIDKLSNEGTKNYKSYALVLKSDFLLSQGNLIEVEKIYDEIIDTTNNSLLKNLAILKLSYIKVDNYSFDQMKQELGDLLGDKTLGLFAHEVLAMSAYKNEVYDKGIASLEIILSDERTTNSMFDRAQMMLKVLSSKI